MEKTSVKLSFKVFHFTSNSGTTKKNIDNTSATASENNNYNSNKTPKTVKPLNLNTVQSKKNLNKNPTSTNLTPKNGSGGIQPTSKELPNSHRAADTTSNIMLIYYKIIFRYFKEKFHG